MAKAKNKTIYVCQNCGAQRPRWEGKCTDCNAWNSFVEETIVSETAQKGWSLGQTTSGPSILKAVTLDQNIEQLKVVRVQTGITEFDRVLGGGIVQGSFVLLGGSPGVGKSTLLMQMAKGVAQNSKKILYISAEESVAQTGLRAQRLGVKSPLVHVASESNLTLIKELTTKINPDILVIDSIQTIFLPEVVAAPGSVSQVRECAGNLMGLAKTNGISVLLIGHVTKDGSIAGPKVLEHMVDCVLSFDGDLTHQFRLLRSLKNRFGTTHELGVFKMNHLGLEEVSNPSELFLEERGNSLIGSSVFASIEGSRPLLCEVQALTIQSPMAMPRRTAIGVETNRLHLLSAVIDRQLGIQLSNHDIFINVVGGLELNDPSSDLAVAASLISTAKDININSKCVFFGEIGLTGEVRAVQFADLRLREADKLGFQYFVLPLSNKKHIDEVKLSKQKKVFFVKNIQDLEQIIKRMGHDE